MTKIIETERLILRTWEKSDELPYFKINQDEKVTKFLRGTMSLEEVKNFMFQQNIQCEQRKYCLFATEIKKTKTLIGFVGLNYVEWESHFTPAVEIAWRLGSEYWQNGFATEAAKDCLTYAFQEKNIDEIVAFTFKDNKKSIRVMEKIGMIRDFMGDFNHPKLEENHPLANHILYRKKFLRH